jgi:hypothetical protein
MSEPTLEELPRFARARHLRRCFGFTKDDLRKFVGAGVIIAHRFLGDQKAKPHFLREELLVALRDNRLELAPGVRTLATAGKAERLKAKKLKRKCAA